MPCVRGGARDETRSREDVLRWGRVCETGLPPLALLGTLKAERHAGACAGAGQRIEPLSSRVYSNTGLGWDTMPKKKLGAQWASVCLLGATSNESVLERPVHL